MWSSYHSQRKFGFLFSKHRPIFLPEQEAFHSENDYYATALHEIAHSTGHPSRLNRDLSGKFGSKSYATEELKAEFASVFIGQEKGLIITLKII